MWFGQYPYSPESGGHFFLMPEAGSRKERQMGNVGSWFLSMGDARARIEEWRIDYNQNRPHSSLSGLTPAEFADKLQPARKVA